MHNSMYCGESDQLADSRQLTSPWQKAIVHASSDAVSITSRTLAHAEAHR